MNTRYSKILEQLQQALGRTTQKRPDLTWALLLFWLLVASIARGVFVTQKLPLKLSSTRHFAYLGYPTWYSLPIKIRETKQVKDASLTGNFAYIDNQNVYMSTSRASDPWQIDMRRFRIYLREKYNVVTANLFMGAFNGRNQDMYSAFQQYGYILLFREHGAELKGKKKGNVDTDIVFEAMRDAHTNAQMDKVVLVSGDGDYMRLVDHLITIQKFEKILLPSHKNASSLYKSITAKYFTYLDTPDMRNKLERK